MTKITAAAVKALRDKTGLPMMDCKRALQDAAGDREKAVELLREAGLRAEIREGFRLRDEDEAVVVRQSHGAGSLVDRGTTVTLDTL